MNTDRDIILNKLNQEQKRAVLQKDGPVLIIAGAGSGKTRVLTSKIALLLSEGVSPVNILALTFTKKAAGEMKTRVASMVGDKARGLSIGTFHSVFIQFLRTYHEFVGFPADFTIYDESDSESCLKQCIGEVIYGPQWNDKAAIKHLSDEQKVARKAIFNIYKPKIVHSIISYAKNELVLPKQYAEDRDRAYKDIQNGREKMPQIYELYMKKCRKAGAMDFDDILVYMDYLLERFPEVKKNLAERFRYILVDEYQDTNYVQYRIIEQLASVHRNICVVGDDSQSIYAFRGARIQNILHFRDRYPEMKTFRLETNYRSTSKIVDAANRLIANNENRLPKTCVSSRGEGKDIHVEECESDREEARFVVNYVLEQVHRHGMRYTDFAVLYRTNAQSRALEDAFLKAHVPYLIYSGMSFFERAEIKDTLAYLRLVVNPSDDEAFKRICNKPTRGISDATLATLVARQAVAEGAQSLMQLAREATPESTGLKQKACACLRSFAVLIDTLRKETTGQDALVAASTIVAKSGIWEFYRAEEGEDGLKKSNNIRELLNSVQYFIQDRTEEYENDLPDGPLKVGLVDYLENIALLSNADTRGEEAESVSLMTSHCSKGLEYKVVFVVGAEETLFPLVREDSTSFDEEEERRLFYVSITRAMDELVLTHCKMRYRYGMPLMPEPSRFLREMNV